MTTLPYVGAPADSEEDPTKKNVTAPPILKQAEEAIAQNVGAPASDADRERIFQYRAAPYLKQIDKTTENLSKYYEQQGLRFSTERRDMIGEKVQEIGKQLGESVMVPQLEREKADQQAWASLGINLGTTQANIALQDRQQALAETNAAMDRAAVQSRETGVFKDPVTGKDYDTLAKEAQKFGQGIEERKTTLMETNAAYDRAQSRGAATGIYIDPVTGISSDTLDKQRLALDKIVQRATATGWWEEEATLNRETLLKAAGADKDNGLGASPPGTAPPPAAPPPAGADQDTVKERATANAAEMDFMATQLPRYQQATHAPMPALQTLVTELGMDDASKLLDRLLAGEQITVGELKALTLIAHHSTAAFFALADMLTAEGTDDNSRVWLANKDFAVGNAQQSMQENIEAHPTAPAPSLPPESVDPAQAYRFVQVPDYRVQYTGSGPLDRAAVVEGLTNGSLIMAEGSYSYPWLVQKKGGTIVARILPEPNNNSAGAPARDASPANQPPQQAQRSSGLTRSTAKAGSRQASSSRK